MEFPVWENVLIAGTAFGSEFFDGRGQSEKLVHVQIHAGGSEAKLWLDPHSQGFDARTLRELVELVQGHRELIERTWNEHFN